MMMAAGVATMLGACTAEQVSDGQEDATEVSETDETSALPASFPAPNVAGRSFRIEGIPAIDRTVFGTKRRYRNELDGATVQTGYYAVTPDNQLCFHFDDVTGNPCFSLRPDPDEKGVYILDQIGGPATARLIDDDPSDLDG